jgi:hypothetical protein
MKPVPGAKNQEPNSKTQIHLHYWDLGFGSWDLVLGILVLGILVLGIWFLVLGKLPHVLENPPPAQ